MRRHSHTPARQITAVSQAAPGEPKSHATPAPMPPATPEATSPKTVSREFVVTSDMPGGSTRGVTAALSTPNDLDSTMIPSAAG
jgi:hypothetical protein